MQSSQKKATDPQDHYPSVKTLRDTGLWTDIPVALTYDDVLLVPNRSSIQSRSDVNASSMVSKGIEVSIPIISSNMDTVTEANMAIAMARDGGIGFIHRFMSIKDQVNQVDQVKRSESILIEKPYTILEHATLGDAWELYEKRSVSGILVVDKEHKLKGILTQRDVLFEDNEDIPISDLMTKDVITARTDISLSDAKDLLKSHRIEKLPLVDSDGVLSGLITTKDLTKTKMWPNATKDGKGRLQVGAAIGVKGEYLHRAEALYEAGCDIIVVDIAHGHSDLAINAVKDIRKTIGEDIEIIAGNVATALGTADLIAAGADGIKVGVGPGSICITRIVAGSGVPQLTAVMESARVGHDMGIPIIADGGIRTSGDIAKAIAAGASTVMLGNLLAGTTESPGVPVLRNGRQVKIIRGMASLGASLGRDKRTTGDFDDDFSDVVPEGVEAIVPYRGATTDVLSQLVGGLRSGMSYVGAQSIQDMWELARFVRVTKAGNTESGSHDVDLV